MPANTQDEKVAQAYWVLMNVLAATVPPRWQPWTRRRHRMAVERLTELGRRAGVFEPHDPERRHA